MRVVLAFIKWILVNIGQGLLELHSSFKRELKREPVMALVAWFFVSLLTSVAMLFLLGGINHFIGLNIPMQVWLSYMASCVFYLLYTGFSVMYNTFKAERAELFETIKNGR